MESVVYDKLMHVLNAYEDSCKCEQCISDIMCITLNKIKPKYVNTRTGEVLSKMAKVTAQEEIDILNAICESYAIVRNAPRHDK